MRKLLIWLIWRVPLGILAPWVFGLVVGRMPHRAEEGE